MLVSMHSNILFQWTILWSWLRCTSPNFGTSVLVDLFILLCFMFFYAATTDDPTHLHYIAHAQIFNLHYPVKINQPFNQATEKPNEGIWKTEDGFPGWLAAGEVKDLEKSTGMPLAVIHPPPHPPHAEKGQCCVITGGRWHCSLLTAGAPILDHVAKERNAPTAPSICCTSQAERPGKGQAGGAGSREGDTEKSIAAVALSASGLQPVPGAPGAPGPWTHITDSFEALTHPAPGSHRLLAGATHWPPTPPLHPSAPPLYGIASCCQSAAARAIDLGFGRVSPDGNGVSFLFLRFNLGKWLLALITCTQTRCRVVGAVKMSRIDVGSGRCPSFSPTTRGGEGH